MIISVRGCLMREPRGVASIMIGAVLVAPALIAIAGSGAASATAEQPTPTQVAVFPADPNPATTLPRDSIEFAGATGFLHRFDQYQGVPSLGSGYIWTDYATGT